ncbi:hypothetical protein [Rathayibacter rathayi]|nr:hypothetical protein [Rathayibacter rathayi]MWV75656.1 hypothetical protein [Rathayibacter rathayi NCPPB 2980 = VKM Ac-1601]TWD68904.1 hypothetical protein FB469_0609 [Rathayibacter rathayi]SOE05567.1 hypothetical protein SAMN06295924_11115 [Rathayibacter rathayi NCPPB 2980 = VKM Ac-1601]
MKRRRTLMALVAGATIAFSPVAQAATTYTDYTTKAEIPDYDCGSDACTAAQGFAVTTNYLYTIKTDSEHGKSVIYRVDRSSGDRVLMHNATSDSNVNTWLGHANDMEIASIGGQKYMFVVTMFDSGSGADSTKQLVRLKYTGTSYEWDHTYTLLSGTTPKKISGLSKISQSGTSIDFFFSSGDQVYRGSLDATAPGGSANDVPLTTAFTMNNKPSGWDSQGIHYDAAHQRFYRPVTSGNRSRILLYDGITPATTGARSSSADVKIDITSANDAKFEIEGVGVNAESGKLYFSTNRTGSDGVHYVNGYSA